MHVGALPFTRPAVRRPAVRRCRCGLLSAGGRVAASWLPTQRVTEHELTDKVTQSRLVTEAGREGLCPGGGHDHTWVPSWGAAFGVALGCAGRLAIVVWPGSTHVRLHLGGELPCGLWLSWSRAVSCMYLLVRLFSWIACAGGGAPSACAGIFDTRLRRFIAVPRSPPQPAVWPHDSDDGPAAGEAHTRPSLKITLATTAR